MLPPSESYVVSQIVIRLDWTIDTKEELNQGRHLGVPRTIILRD